MTSQAPKKRGRPRKVYPFFSDPEAERERVEKCIAMGRDPYPPFKHEPCEAELALRKEIIPGVPFKLVLAMYDVDADGLPYTSPVVLQRWEDAAANRKQAACEGAEMSPHSNRAANIIREEAGYIRQKRLQGAKKSEVIKWIGANRARAGKSVAGRTEMYKQLNLSGLW